MDKQVDEIIEQFDRFKRLVERTRYWQRQYFETRSPEAMGYAKYGEKTIDECIKHGFGLTESLKIDNAVQTELFEDGNNE